MSPDQRVDTWRAALAHAAQQRQFLEVVSRAEAEARLERTLAPKPLGIERVALGEARGRVLASDVAAPVDVPGFDRASVDGFAVRARDTGGASEAKPVILSLNPEVLTPGVAPTREIEGGSATAIATGGMLPRGADAVVMIEDTESEPGAGGLAVAIHRAIAPGRFVALAGSDIARGETVLREGALLGPREIAMLAAVGLAEVSVWRRPRVAILSTGDEIVAPGAAIRPGQVYDSNAAVLAAATAELGAEPVALGIVPDDEAALTRALDEALARADVVLLSGGTSKGAGDLSYRAAQRLTDPGIIVHGVALKPGKPLCLAVTRGRLVAILPGFPTSAMFTFHALVAPVIAVLAGRRKRREASVAARLPLAITSERGRVEYVMASLMPAEGGLAAYPIAKGSGAVTSFTGADGFFAVPANTEQMPAGSAVEVTLLDADVKPADLIAIGSHCVGLDFLIGALEKEGFRVKALNVGSSGGLAAARRGECDVAAVHLMDAKTGLYNRPFLTETLTLVRGYQREQGFVFRKDDRRFAGAANAEAAIALALADPACLIVNRNAGSGTRILTDRLLDGRRPPGYFYQTKSHNGVAIAIVQRRADWGIAIATVARAYGLGFLPVQAEQFDFIVPRARRERPAVRRFIALLADPDIRARLAAMGFANPAEAAP